MHLASMDRAAMEWVKTIVLLKIAICSVYYSADAQTLSVSGGLMNNGPVAINFQPLYTASFSSVDFAACSWKRNSEPSIPFYNLNCLSATSLATNNVTCSINGNTITGTYLPPAVKANVTISLICNPAFPQPNFVLSAQPCGNPGRYRVTPNVPANTGYGDSHNFTCLENSPNKFQVAVCQADASWNLTLDCTPAATTADMSTASMRNTVSSAELSTNNNLVTTTPAATTTSAGATAFGSFWNGTPLVMLFVSVVCNHI